jgi:hypothetical protein
MVKPLLPLVITALALAAPAHATLYKCLLPDGRVFYQDAACEPGRELRDFDKDPANVSVVPFTTPGSPQHAPAKSVRSKAEKAPPKSGKTTERAGDPAERKFLRPGMSEGEVLARVGPPDMTSSKNRKGHRWTYMPMPADPHTITNLQFENGRLVEIERKVIR